MKHFSGRPFVIVGVNSDENMERAVTAAKREKMTWPNFYDKPAESAESIAALWNISGWPSIRLIDAKGNICPTPSHNEEQLQATIEKLLPPSADFP